MKLERFARQTLLVMPFLFAGMFARAQSVSYPAAAKVAADFRKLLSRPAVPLNPSFRIIEQDSMEVEKGSIQTELSERVPVLIYKPLTKGKKTYPAVIFLHGTGGSKDNADLKNILYQLCRRGFIAAGIDARYHGERIPGRAHGAEEYTEAIYLAWKNKNAKQQHPFFYDTAYDLWKLIDYLVSRPDVDAGRIGMGGISMGGIETWMAASVDTRIKVAVLDIAAQSFRWSLENNRWQGRAHTIWKAHEQVAKDLGDTAVNQKNVELLWNKVVPGVTAEFDCPSMIRLFAPRALLILSNEKDQNCPLPGAEIAYQSALKRYTDEHATDRLKRNISLNEPHRSGPEHLHMTLDWFSRWL